MGAPCVLGGRGVCGCTFFSYQQVDANIIKAVQYLLKNFEENDNKFYDRSVVGSGHRGLLNLQYPVYAYSFPVIALARARSYFMGDKRPFINKELNAKVVQYEVVREMKSGVNEVKDL